MRVSEQERDQASWYGVSATNSQEIISGSGVDAQPAGAAGRPCESHPRQKFPTGGTYPSPRWNVMWS